MHVDWEAAGRVFWLLHYSLILTSLEKSFWSKFLLFWVLSMRNEMLGVFQRYRMLLTPIWIEAAGFESLLKKKTNPKPKKPKPMDLNVGLPKSEATLKDRQKHRTADRFPYPAGFWHESPSLVPGRKIQRRLWIGPRWVSSPLSEISCAEDGLSLHFLVII